MKILFLNKNFYEYDTAIADEFKKNGHQLDSFCITRELTLIEKILQRFFGNINREIIDIDYQKQMLKTVFEKEYDVIFVLAGQGLRRVTVEKLKTRYPSAKLVWYIWDSVKNLNVFNDIKDLFDITISFDKYEASELKLAYLPLFYIKKIQQNYKKIDVSMIGQDRDYRRNILKKLSKCMKYNNSFFYLKTGRIEKIKSIFKGDKELYSWLKTKSLSYAETCEVMSQSRIIIDIPAPNQAGLTMRTIEAIGFHTKMITTNQMVQKYDFYNPNNILIINPDDIHIPSSFINSDYEELPDEVVNSYSLETWAKKLLEYMSK